MRLEDKFFNTFFYLFLVVISLSLILVSVILFYYSNNYLDEQTSHDIFEMELKYAKSNINSMNVLLSNLVLKMQIVLKEELIL